MKATKDTRMTVDEVSRFGRKVFLCLVTVSIPISVWLWKINFFGGHEKTMTLSTGIKLFILWIIGPIDVCAIIAIIIIGSRVLYRGSKACLPDRDKGLLAVPIIIGVTMFLLSALVTFGHWWASLFVAITFFLFFTIAVYIRDEELEEKEGKR